MRWMKASVASIPSHPVYDCESRKPSYVEPRRDLLPENCIVYVCDSSDFHTVFASNRFCTGSWNVLLMQILFVYAQHVDFILIILVCLHRSKVLMLIRGNYYSNLYLHLHTLWAILVNIFTEVYAVFTDRNLTGVDTGYLTHQRYLHYWFN